MSDHATLAPSSASRWVNCTGSVQMAMLCPETEESEQARWGTAAHELAARMINAHARGHIGYPERAIVIGTAASNGVVIDDEMFDAAELYADDVATVMRSTGVFGGLDFGNEARLPPSPRINEENWGTVDQYLFHRAAGVLYLWDAKFGHKIVEAFENWQCVNYAALVLDMLGVNGVSDQHIEVRIRIAQPLAYHRDGPIREWITNAADLRASINILHSKATEALSGDAVVTPGKWCDYCPARHVCRGLQFAALASVDYAYQPVPELLSPAHVGTELANLHRAQQYIDARVSGLEAQAGSLIRSGKHVPNYTMENTFGREKWTKPADEIATLGDLYGVDLRKNEVVTPNQARKLGIDATVINAYAEKPRTGLKLVQDDGTLLRRVFSQLNKE